jgi:hypothetical protein
MLSGDRLNPLTKVISPEHADVGSAGHTFTL